MFGVLMLTFVASLKMRRLIELKGARRVLIGQEFGGCSRRAEVDAEHRSVDRLLLSSGAPRHGSFRRERRGCLTAQVRKMRPHVWHRRACTMGARCQRQHHLACNIAVRTSACSSTSSSFDNLRLDRLLSARVSRKRAIALVPGGGSLGSSERHEGIHGVRGCGAPVRVPSFCT